MKKLKVKKSYKGVSNLAYKALLKYSAYTTSSIICDINIFPAGSSQDLTLDSGRQMDLSEDARSRKISAEVMKHRLYESVITSPRRRRYSQRSDYW